FPSCSQPPCPTSEFLPPELEREIFELAYRCNPMDGLNLKLVAQRVRVWIDILVYETVKLTTNNGATKFLEAARQKDPVFFTAVKKLSLTYDVSPTQAVEIVSLCPAVEQLACWVRQNDSPQLPLLIRQLPLCCLSIERKHFANILAASALEYLPWINLTHLELVIWNKDEDELRFTQQLVQELRKLPRLTHIAFPICAQPVRVDLITSGLPNLAVVILIVATETEVSDEYSGGVVQISEESLPVEWEVYHSEEGNIWARAERALAARQAAAKEAAKD
ncbi:hypothetical protein FB45DRAFT_945989, partial [Roridomyces roridus]